MEIHYKLDTVNWSNYYCNSRKWGGENKKNNPFKCLFCHTGPKMKMKYD